MIKTFFIVLTMMVSPQNPVTDLYIISEPSFTEPAQCLAFVEQNTQGLVNKAYVEYGGREVDEIYCIEEQRLRQVLKTLEEYTNKKRSI